MKKSALFDALKSQAPAPPLFGDFTIEGHVKPQRKVHHWRGRKFVVRDPWVHVAFVRRGGATEYYAGGVRVG